MSRLRWGSEGGWLRWRVGLAAAAGLIAIASLFTHLPETSERPLLEGARIDPAVLAIIRQSCGDCHSEATHYPWYSYVAPSSLLVASDVGRGRRHLNLSRWKEYTTVRRMRNLSEMANQVKDGEMPLWWYTIIHRNAKLSKADVDAIFAWTQTERARLIDEQSRQEP